MKGAYGRSGEGLVEGLVEGALTSEFRQVSASAIVEPATGTALPQLPGFQSPL